MDLIIKHIPPEYLSLKINYCRQQLAELPEVNLQVYTLHGVQTKVVIVGNHRYRVDSNNGKEYLGYYKKRKYYERQLHVFESVWDGSYKGEPDSECMPMKVCRKLYIDTESPVVLDKKYFDSLKNDADTKYGKPRDYFFNGIFYRSYAEQEIAKYYTAMGIPFKYEPEVYLKGLTYPIYPDFVPYIKELDCCKFHEHFGIKQSASYLRTTGIKYANYTNAGLVPGIDILFTHDTADIPFDIRAFESQLNTAIYSTVLVPPPDDEDE